MSCYEWEQGSFTLPAAEYTKLRNNMAAFLNRRSEEAYEKAVKVWEAVCVEGKGKRKFDWISAAEGYLWKGTRSAYEPNRSWGEGDQRQWVFASMFKREGHFNFINKKPTKPQKKSFPKFQQTKLGSLDFDESCLSFDNKSKSIYWSVGENNHACDSSREHAIGAEFFRLLGRVNFTNRTGGYVFGNDEYNRDEGPGCNYVKDRFGMYANPKSKYYDSISLYR